MLFFLFFFQCLFGRVGLPSPMPLAFALCYCGGGEEAWCSVLQPERGGGTAGGRGEVSCLFCGSKVGVGGGWAVAGWLAGWLAGWGLESGVCAAGGKERRCYSTINQN